MNTLQIYTDGANNSKIKPVPGGWAYVYVYNDMLLRQNWGSKLPTTNQQMELSGAIHGLLDVKEFLNSTDNEYNIQRLEILTDSAYVHRGMLEKWYVDWQFNNWTRKGPHGEVIPIANKELWQQLIRLEKELKADGFIISWTKVKGHSGIMYNEVCDKLAKRGKLEAQSRIEMGSDTFEYKNKEYPGFTLN